MPSPSNSFKGTGKKMLTSLGLSLLGAVATWLAVVNQEFDFGAFAPIVGAFAPFVANALREYVRSTK